METTGIIGVIKGLFGFKRNQGLYGENGKENGSYYSIMGSI